MLSDLQGYVVGGGSLINEITAYATALLKQVIGNVAARLYILLRCVTAN